MNDYVSNDTSVRVAYYTKTDKISNLGRRRTYVSP